MKNLEKEVAVTRLIMKGMRFAVLFVVLLGLALPSAAEEGRIVKELDGTWQFKLDPEKIGEENRWFRAETAFPNKIIVPGAWDVQGYGKETDKLRHNYIGKAWYKKEILIPEHWKGRRLFLYFGGVYRYSKVWVNDHFLGEHIGYMSDFEYDITEFARPGAKALISVEIDSEQRWDVDTLAGCWDSGEGMNAFWGGIWGHVTLEARAPCWLDELYVKPEASLDRCTVSALLLGDLSLPDEVSLEVLDASGKSVFQHTRSLEKSEVDHAILSFEAAIPDAKLWTTDTPFLYTAHLSLRQNGKVLDRVKARFGLRTIEFRGTDILVNGKKVFLRGYGDDCVYPETMFGPSDKEYHLKRLKTAKSYGFDYVRHHSHFMPPEYYQACDEAGVFVSPELPIGYSFYYARAGEIARKLYETEWVAAVKRFRNHPSIFNWGMGNEVRRGFPQASELYRLAKELDPTRPVIDTDGVLPAHGFHDGTADRDTLDFLTIQFNVFTTPLDNPGKFETGKPNKPMITHEAGNYITFPRLDVIDSFQHNFKPFWLVPMRDRLEERGLLDEALMWSEKSEKLYYLCHKLNTEGMRKNPLISGYHWWLLQPWWACSDGLLDIYRRPTSIKPEDVREFNGTVVVLEDGLKQTYRGKEPLEFELLLSNFSGKSFDDTSLGYKITIAYGTLKKGKLPVSGVKNGMLASLGTVSLDLPDPYIPQRISIEVKIENKGEEYSNHWTTWIYPSGDYSPALDVPLYVSLDLLEPLASSSPRPIPEISPLPVRAVYVARQPTMPLIKAAAGGASVVLLSPVDIFPISWTSFKTAWWNGAIEGNTNAGTVVYDHSAINDMAPDGWCDAGWFRLLNGAQTFIMDDFPTGPDILIRALESHDYPLPMSLHADFMHLWRDKSLLFEFGVGEGALIVSGLNFDQALRYGGPEGPWILSRLFEYAGTFPKPKSSLTFEYLRDRVENSLFAKGSLVSGFDNLVYHKGEKTTGLSYQELEVPMYRIHQGRPLHRIEWETEPVKEAERIIFMFAGGLPSMSPSTLPGFTLTLNGKKVLHFDTSRSSRRWESQDKKAALLYVPRPIQTWLRETQGVFYLSVPGEWLEPGQPCRLGVHPRGSAYNRWFGLNTYKNVLNPKK